MSIAVGFALTGVLFLVLAVVFAAYNIGSDWPNEYQDHRSLVWLGWISLAISFIFFLLAIWLGVLL